MLPNANFSSVLVLLKSNIDDDTMHIMQHNCKREMQCKTKALNHSFFLKPLLLTLLLHNTSQKMFKFLWRVPKLGN